MDPGYQHKVLVADDDPAVNKTIARVLQNEDIIFVFSENAETAIEEIKIQKNPFSIIIANQGLSGMKGEDLLSLAKAHSPESTMFLMGTYAEFTAIIDAVNKDLIKRYIVKPINDGDLLRAVQYGIKFFESFFENDRLLNLAKKQNSQLYELSCKLMEEAAVHTKRIHELDQDIGSLEKKLLSLEAPASAKDDPLWNLIWPVIKNESGIDPAKTQLLFFELIKKLYRDFTEAARKKGFEMPSMETEKPDGTI